MEILFPTGVIMMNEQRGVAVGRAGFSLWSRELSLKQRLLSQDVHKHAHKIRSIPQQVAFCPWQRKQKSNWHALE